MQLGKISLDGTKIQAKASKHSALSWGHASELEQQLKEEVARLMGMAQGAEPKAPEPGVRDRDQINRTDEESRILPACGKSFQQAYNVQAGVETESLLIVTEHVTAKANDKPEVQPTLRVLEERAEPLGKAKAWLADNGYHGEGHVKACQGEEITPFIAAGPERHPLPLDQRWADPPPWAAEADAVQAMKHRLATPEGRSLYGRRKCTVEPVFGIIKSVLGFRQFHWRGLKGISGEWTLVSIAWNLKRMFSLEQHKLQAQGA